MTITRFDGPDAGDTSRAANGLNTPGESRASLDAAWKELIATAMRRNVVVAVGDHRTAIEGAARASGVPTEPGAPDPRCIFDGCVATWEHHHGGFPGGYDNPADPTGPPIPFTGPNPAPDAVRDYNGAALASQPVPAPEPSARLIAAARAVVAAVVDDESGMQTFDFALIDDLGDALDDLEA